MPSKLIKYDNIADMSFLRHVVRRKSPREERHHRVVPLPMDPGTETGLGSPPDWRAVQAVVDHAQEAKVFRRTTYAESPDVELTLHVFNKDQIPPDCYWVMCWPFAKSTDESFVRRLWLAPWDGRQWCLSGLPPAERALALGRGLIAFVVQNAGRGLELVISSQTLRGPQAFHHISFTR